MKVSPLYLLSIGMLGILTSCAIHPPDTRVAKQGITVIRDLIYTPEMWALPLKADVYQPQATSLSPAVLLIHGGGWEGPDRRWQMAGIAKKLARRGYVVVNATYRMAPGYAYPAPVEDLQQAIRWMRENSAAYRIDPARIATFGYSAGGHLAALVGLENPQVKAIVAGGAPSDLTLFTDGRLVVQFLGGTRAQVPASYREASPVNHITRKSPPVFIYHGGSDKLVPPEHAVHFKAALDRDHVPNELHWIPGKSHITAFLLPGNAVDEAIRFLDRTLAR